MDVKIWHLIFEWWNPLVLCLAKFGFLARFGFVYLIKSDWLIGEIVVCDHSIFLDAIFDFLIVSYLLSIFFDDIAFSHHRAHLLTHLRRNRLLYLDCALLLHSHRHLYHTLGMRLYLIETVLHPWQLAEYHLLRVLGCLLKHLFEYHLKLYLLEL